MKWFKHFSNARTSLKLNAFIDEYGIKGYGHYWLLLEVLSENFDGENTNITLHYSELSAATRIRSKSQLQVTLMSLQSHSLLTFKSVGSQYEINIPMLRELQDKNSKYNRKRVVGSDPKNKNIDLDKEEELELIHSLTPATSLPCVEPELILPISKPTKKATTKKTPTPTTETWNSYRAAYNNRYGVDPVRNASVSGKLKQFVDRIGLDESPAVAAFYVNHNLQKYVLSGHSVGNLLFDAEKLRTEWARGRQITSFEARHTETRQQVVNVFEKHLNASRGHNGN